MNIALGLPIEEIGRAVEGLIYGFADRLARALPGPASGFTDNDVLASPDDPIPASGRSGLRSSGTG